MDAARWTSKADDNQPSMSWRLQDRLAYFFLRRKNGSHSSHPDFARSKRSTPMPRALAMSNRVCSGLYRSCSTKEKSWTGLHRLKSMFWVWRRWLASFFSDIGICRRASRGRSILVYSPQLLGRFARLRYFLWQCVQIPLWLQQYMSYTATGASFIMAA